MRVMGWASLVGLFMAFAGTGCGGVSSGACGNTAACGGSVVGTWTITSSCVTATASNVSAQCPGATGSASGVSITGTITYNTDGTYTSNTTTSGTVDVYLPPSCLTSGGITLTCAQLDQAFQANPTPGVTLSCTGSSGCTCKETLANSTTSETGTYTTTAAGLLTTTSTGGTASQVNYCVKGTMMTQSPAAGSTMMGQAASGTITLTKG